MTTRVALIADTHGRVDPLLRALFAGADLVVHAGDVGTAVTLAEVADLVPDAPLVAVRGNNDRDDLAALPEVALVNAGGVPLLVVHREVDARVALADPAHAGAVVVVVGHSHRGVAEVRADGRLWVNPGGAGPKRFRLTRSAALLEIDDDALVARVRSLEDEALPVIAEAHRPRR